MFLLHLLRWLRANTTQEFDLLLGRGGPLESEFAKVAEIHAPKTVATRPEFFRRFGLIYSNTCCNGNLLETLPYGDVPIVTHLHELDYGIDCSGAKNFAGVVRQSNHYIACAQAVAERLRHRFRIPAERISVHYEAISLKEVEANVAAESPPSLRKKYDIPENAFVLSACGTFDQRKAPDLFVQLAGRLQRLAGSERPLRFFWIGKKSDGNLLQILQHDVRRLGLQDQVRFVGELPAPHGLLALSDVFCLTSREDPFPLAMLESAALGKPVICFDRAGGGMEFCAHGGGFAVPFIDVAAMADKCRELMVDPARLKAIGRCAAEIARTRFATEAVLPDLGREIAGMLRVPPAMSVHRARNRTVAEIYESWLLEEAPEGPFVLAHLARQASRRQAQALLRAGKRGEAIQVLLRASRADMETKVPAVIVESLVELSEDLAPLDAAKSRYMAEEAEKFAQRARIDLAAVRWPKPRPVPKAVLQAG